MTLHIRPAAFVLEPCESRADELRVRFDLDPRQPYLDDHRPGGDPLFGTVMQLEAMTGVSMALAPGLPLRRFEAVENHRPLILRKGVEPRAFASARVIAQSLSEVTLQCSIASMPPSGPPVTHCQGRVVLGVDALPHLPRGTPAHAAHAGREVKADDIYALFFHGPAYRVIAAASWDGHRLKCRLAERLPPIFLPPLLSGAAAPRLIEFALQSAGLFEIARNRRMMIPHSIERIERYGNADVDDRQPLWALARPSEGSGHASPALDISVVDTHGHMHLLVSGYRALPLSFDIDSEKVAQLHDSFT